jgi:hypothetical protein
MQNFDPKMRVYIYMYICRVEATATIVGELTEALALTGGGYFHGMVLCNVEKTLVPH